MGCYGGVLSLVLGGRYLNIDLPTLQTDKYGENPLVPAKCHQKTSKALWNHSWRAFVYIFHHDSMLCDVRRSCAIYSKMSQSINQSIQDF